MQKTGVIHQLNVSTGGVPKWPVAEARVDANGLEGDKQADRGRHGGPDRAVSLYSFECIQALRAEGHSIAAGSAGENVTLRGIDWRLMVPEVRVRLGEDALIELTDYAAPCLKNARWFSDGDFERLDQFANPGFSRVCARVLEEGLLRPGMRAVVLEAPPGAQLRRLRIPTLRWRPPQD